MGRAVRKGSRTRSTKRAKHARRAAVLAAYQQRLAARDALPDTQPAPPRTRLLTYRQRRVLYPSGGMKQRIKHAGRRHAVWQVKNRARLDSLCAELAAAVATHNSPVSPTTLSFWGSSFPFLVEGEAGDLVFAFRFRFDRAFLEVGSPGEHGVAEVVWAASRDDVTGEPYEGGLSDKAALRLVAELFGELCAPAVGTLFHERLSNTVRLLEGGGDPLAPHLIRELYERRRRRPVDGGL